MATRGKKSDKIYFPLQHYVGTPPEAWARQKGLEARLSLLQDYHAKKRVALEHAAAACKRLADFSTWMQDEAGRGV